MKSNIMYALEETAREYSYNYECDFVNYMIDVMFVNSVIANTQSERTKEVLTEKLLSKYERKTHEEKKRSNISGVCFNSCVNIMHLLRYVIATRSTNKNNINACG